MRNGDAWETEEYEPLSRAYYHAMRKDQEENRNLSVALSREGD
jgi:hypothetical protein